MTPTTRPSLWMLAAALLLTSGLAPDAQAESTEALQPLTPAWGEEGVQTIYGHWEQDVRASGHEVSVSLSGFQTFEPEDFDEQYWVEIVTPPGGWTLSSGITIFEEYEGEIKKEIGVHLAPTWSQVEDWLAHQPDLVYQLTYADVIAARLGAHHPRVVALTTYSVEIRYAGRTRTYRAATEWHETKGAGWSGNVHDHVIPDLLRAIGVDLEVMREHPLLAEDPAGGPSEDTECIEHTLNVDVKDPETLPFGDSTGHVNGRHEAQGFHKFRCKCETSCLSRCTPTQDEPICQDFGTLDRFLQCHRPHKSVHFSPAINAFEGAQCASAMACHFQECTLCDCSGLTISFGGGPAGITISVQGITLWGFNSTPTMRCPNCALINEPRPPPTLPCPNPTPPELHTEPVIGTVSDIERAGFRSYPLDRVESLDGIHYTMEEWAIVVIERSDAGIVTDVRVPAASSSGYATFQRESLVRHLEVLGTKAAAAAPAGAERSVLLVIHSARHRNNARWIPLPNPHLEPATLPVHAQGRAVVRADFGEDRSLIALDVLYGDRPLTAEERSALETNLTLSYGSDDRHRAVLYGVVRLGGGGLSLERWKIVLPECCVP